MMSVNSQNNDNCLQVPTTAMIHKRVHKASHSGAAGKMKRDFRKVQYLTAALVSVATVTMGMSSAWPTPVIPKFFSNETSFHINKDEIGWMLAMSSPGFMVGSFVSGFTSDRVGRRATILMSALPYGAGMIIVAFAKTSWLLYIMKFLWSWGTGMISNVLPLYFAEISDKDIRGTLLLITRITFNLGSLLMMCIGSLLPYDTLNYVLLVLPISYLFACWWIPESPYWYLKEGKVNSARKCLVILRGGQDIEEELSQMQSDVKNEMRHSGSIVELITGSQYRMAIIIASGLKVAQIMTGAVTIQQYLGLIMKESHINIELSTVIIIFGALRFVVLPSILADRLGRRPLLISSFVGTSICLATVGLYFFLLEVIRLNQRSITPYGFVPFTGIICSNILSTIGYNSIITIIPGEIFPLNVKAVAMTSLNIFGGVLSFAIARGYQALKDEIGLCGVFWVFSTISLLGSVFCVFIIPETKRKSLKEIQEQLQGKLYLDTVKNDADTNVNSGVAIESKMISSSGRRQEFVELIAKNYEVNESKGKDDEK